MANLKEEVFSMGFSVHEWRFVFFCGHSFFSHGWDNPTEWEHTNWDDPSKQRLGQKGSERGTVFEFEQKTSW
jgi:hypothetical protein